MSDEQEQESQELIPTVQDTILFHGKPLIVVRLPDGRPGVVLRWICENLSIGQKAQVERIKRTEVIASDLVYVQVQTEGGFQTMPTLVLDSVPYWLATIDTKRVKETEQRIEILHYQKRAVAALFTWASSLKAVADPPNLVPSEPIAEPTRPALDAPPEIWLQFHEQMAAWYRWRMDIEEWRGSVESRLEGLEAITELIPEILERLGPETLTPAHQQKTRQYVKALSEKTGKHYNTVWEELKTAFEVAQYPDILDEEWPKVEQWFTVQLERALRTR